MKKYGHLRPGTYNILAKRYDSTPGLFSHFEKIERETYPDREFCVSKAQVSAINDIFLKYDLKFSAEALLNFVRCSIEYREYSKFVFTKGLSDAIELIAKSAKQRFSRQDMALLDLNTLMEARNIKPFDWQRVEDKWKDTISKNKKNKELFNKIALPQILRNSDELLIVPYYESHPNFVTRKRVEGNTLLIQQFDVHEAPHLKDRIVLIDNADPGYDWIFTQNPRGLVTKYGGVGSHMAIRCGEFSLPSAIGCGEAIFDRLVMSSGALIDCETETIVPI